ncbi:MAG: hypothetical protein EBT39_04555, partial [Sphingobacteriia bacterium]|nr:hypothetical protein [Candidatus Fonsibacter lacus]
LKSDLLQIRYENGTKDDFNSIKKTVENNIYLIDDSVQGKNDAQLFYQNYKIAGTAVLASGYFVPLLIPSLAISIATTAKIPKDENLNFPSASLMQNEKYAKSYRQEAFKIKRKKVWLNFIVTLPLALLGIIYICLK